MPPVDWKIVAAIVFALVLFFAGWEVNGWRLNAALQTEKTAHATDLKRVSDAAAQAAGEAIAQHDEDVKRIGEIAKTYNEALNDANVKNDRQQRDIAAGNRRLYVSTIHATVGDNLSATSAAASGVAAETRSQLDPATGSAIYAIAIDGDNAIRQLNSLIDACSPN
ncbi:MAG: hypothetical protein JWM78_1679 [Verrucomicrobiaceae bacterium]|nr:hypothetical protein [Verrucomicrobiaceae bacterium]